MQKIEQSLSFEQLKPILTSGQRQLWLQMRRAEYGDHWLGVRIQSQFFQHSMSVKTPLISSEQYQNNKLKQGVNDESL